MTTTEKLTIKQAFDALQSAVNADPELVKTARERRAMFETAFLAQDDVGEFVFSGSLERRTQRDPMNDVDVIVVYDPGQHSDWGAASSGSAAAALEHCRSQVNDLLGATNGTIEKLVRLAKPRNHAVKCFVDDPGDTDAFTVDVMPALRQPDGTLLVPEAISDTWIKTDPELLIQRVADRQADWDYFVPLVRVLKYWSKERGCGMKSLVAEVLALNKLPSDASRQECLQRFFTAAAIAIDAPIEDPARLCGDIQPDLDRNKAKECLDNAASLSWQAVNAEAAGDTDHALCLWHEIFGEPVPQPEGGCDNSEDEIVGKSFSVGVGAIGVDRARPIVDSPQG